MAQLDDGESRITLRMPMDLHRKLVAWAEGNVRSLNGEIVTRLERSFEQASVDGRREDIRELETKYFSALEKENEALRRAGLLLEQMIGVLTQCIEQAANGDSSELDKFIDRAKNGPLFKQLGTISSITKDD